MLFKVCYRYKLNYFLNKNTNMAYKYESYIPEIKSLIQQFPNITNKEITNTLFKTNDFIGHSTFYKMVCKLTSKKEIIKKEINKILVVGDLHEPFCLDGYLDHCITAYNKYKCNKVIFIGDIIDNHFSSFHEIDPDGMSAGMELDYAIKKLSKWYDAFPQATVIIGNHDRLIMRKAMAGGVSKRWIKEFNEVLEVPGWNFVEQLEIDNVLYIHGEGGTARQRARKDLQSVVQGHLHTQCYTEWIVGSNFKIFGLQVGCGINNKSYSMAYAKNYGKPAIACAVILDGGKLPINLLMNL